MESQNIDSMIENDVVMVTIEQSYGSNHSGLTVDKLSIDRAQ